MITKRLSATCSTTLNTAACIGIALLASPTPALAYLGPGAGLGMIGSLIAIVVVGLVIILGLVVYPIRMLRKRRNSAVSDDKTAQGKY